MHITAIATCVEESGGSNIVNVVVPVTEDVHVLDIHKSSGSITSVCDTVVPIC